MPPKGYKGTGHLRWSDGGNGVLHAWPSSLHWTADQPPACGLPIKRKMLGRPGAPPVGANMCASCVAAVGFRRRPRTSRMWAIKRAAREAEESGRGPEPIQVVLAELRQLHEEVAEMRGLLLAVRAAQGPEGYGAVMDGAGAPGDG